MRTCVITLEGEQVLDHVEVARSMWARGMGLMFRREPPADGLLLDPGGSVHGHFVRFPLDVLFLAADGEVLSARRLKPWGLAMAPRRCRRVLELPVGRLGALASLVGRTLTPVA